MTLEEENIKLRITLHYILKTQHNSNCSFIHSDDLECDCHIRLASDCLKALDENTGHDC